MNNQSELKKAWIFKTLDRMSAPDRIEAELIEAVFNIPLKDAKALLIEYKGANNDY